MASPTRSELLREREEERRLNLRTLVIASAASATAAVVTSQLWIHGTWIAAALTPALVALISEALHRPTERIARARTSEQPALGVRAPSPNEPVAPPHGDPLGPPDPGQAAPGAVRVYRQPSGRPPRRRLALGVVAATAAIAFVIAVAVITAGDLVSGGSIGKGGARTTLLGGKGKKHAAQPDTPTRSTPDQTTPDKTPTTDQPPPATDTPPDQQPSDTAPITPPETAPDGLP